MNAADGSNTHVELQSAENLNGAANNNTALMLKGRTLIRGLVKPVNASLTFGGAVIGVLDFLSPRIALLPIAATVAVVVLIGTVLLRKFFAPHLPDGNTLKTLFAPQASMHRSPVIVAGGVLSALMVAGAAWSSAAAPSGGIIASKFDAARNAQMQLGVLQVMQKEQRGQTAVMEDIREGRAANPRRELANQGTLWTENEFRNALDRGDVQVSSLFLSGGMPWKLVYTKKIFENGDKSILQLLLTYPQLLIERTDQCAWFMSNFVKVSKGSSTSTRASDSENAERAHILIPIEKSFLKNFCSTSADLMFAKNKLSDGEKWEQRDFKVYNEKIANYKSAELCVQETLSNNARKLMNDTNNFNPMGRGTYSNYDSLLADVQARMMTGVRSLNIEIDAAVKSYCQKQAEESKPTLGNGNRLLVESWKQIVDAVS